MPIACLSVRRAEDDATAVVAALSLLAFAAHAQETQPATSPAQLTPVVVVGTTPLQSIGAPLANVPANVQIGTARQIEQQQSLNLGEFLDSNLVEAFGDVVNWDLIPTNAIAGIDLIPGSNPLFGLNTLGGAIVVNTKNGADDPGFKATAYAGSWGRRAFEAEFGGVDATHNVDYYLATNFFHEDGYRDWSRSDVNQLFTKERWHDTGSTLEWSLALADNTLYGPAVLPLSMLHNPSYAYTAPDFDVDKNALVELKGSHFIADNELLEGNVYYRVSNITGGNSNASCDDDVSTPENCVARQAFGDLDASNVLSSTDQRSLGGSAQLTLQGDIAGHRNKLTFSGSIDTSKVGYDSNNYGANLIGEVTYTIAPSGSDAINTTGSNPYFQGGTSLTTRSNDYGLFATDNFAFNDQWNMTLSGRYNYATVDLEGSSVDGDMNPIGSLDGNHGYHRFNPAVGLNFNPVKDIGFYGGYSEGMRVPSPIELSCANPAIPCALPTGFTSDPNLEMIVSRTWEAGTRGKFTATTGWDLAVYDTGNQNDIQFIANGANNGVTGFFQNVGKTDRKGIELGLHGKFDRLTLAANYGYVDATYQSTFRQR